MTSTNPITLTPSYHCCLILTQCTASSPRNAQLSQLDLVSILFNQTPLKYSAAQLIQQFNNFNNYLVWSGLRSKFSSSESRAKRQIQNLKGKCSSESQTPCRHGVPLKSPFIIQIVVSVIRPLFHRWLSVGGCY